MTAPARSATHRGTGGQIGRRALGLALLVAVGGARAQFAATLGIDSVNRYRGAGTDDVGPVVRASVMADAPQGAYGGVSGLWRTRDAGLASADAMVGWSGRLDALPGLQNLSPQWAWDTGVHRTHYGDGARYDFTEAMAGLIASEGTLRTWYAPRYFGGRTHTLYTELNASHALDDRWHAFAHVGWLHYGPAPAHQARLGDRVDTLAGIGCAVERWDLRLSRDGIVAGQAPDDIDARRRRAAWILGAAVAF